MEAREAQEKQFDWSSPLVITNYCHQLLTGNVPFFRWDGYHSRCAPFSSRLSLRAHCTEKTLCSVSPVTKNDNDSVINVACCCGDTKTLAETRLGPFAHQTHYCYLWSWRVWLHSDYRNPRAGLNLRAHLLWIIVCWPPISPVALTAWSRWLLCSPFL